jgi:hypothetical protein
VGSLSPAQAAQSVTLAWNPDTDPTVVGYRLHDGTSSGNYSQTIEVGNTTTATVSNLTAGRRYYFTVTAYNAAGLESLPSNQVSFMATPAATTGTANSSGGAPTASLTTTRNGSWVVGVGNDYDNAINRTAGTTQTLVHQDLTPTGDTYWVQMQTAPTPWSGTRVTINDAAPTTDRYNLSICEVLSAP